MENEIPETEHVPLPSGLYKYGEPYATGVRPVYGAHQQLLWYSVPGLYTRFYDLEEAESIVFERIARSSLKAENERMKEAIDVTMSLLAGNPSREDVEMAYDHLYDTRYKTALQPPTT